MDAKLFLPYHPNGKMADGSNDMSDEEYARALLDQFGAEYNSFMNKAISDAYDSRYDMVDIIPEKYRIESVADSDETMRYEFDCQINDDDDKPVSDGELEYYVRSGEVCAFFVHVTTNEWTNEDAVSELNFWIRDCIGIMNDRNIDDDYKVGMLPCKDLVVFTPSNRFVFCGSRVVDRDDSNNFAILVNKIKRY